MRLRWGLSVCAILGLGVPLGAQPANDSCASATFVQEGSFALDNTGAVVNGPSDCDLDMTTDVWFRYEASASGSATIGTCTTVGTLTDTTLIVYDAALGCPVAGSACLASDDDSCGPAAFNSTVTIPVTGGDEYFVQVGGWNGSTGTGTLTIALGDICGFATPIQEGTTFFDNAGAADDGPDDCDLNMSGDLWFRYTASTSGFVTIDTCASVVLDDTTLIVYDAALGCPIPGSACLASDDDTCGPAGFNSSVSILVTTGQSYLIQVGGWNGTTGDGVLTITPPPPANDDCATAVPIFAGSTLYHNIGAATNGPATCDPNMTTDVWFVYTAGGTGPATIDSCATTGTLVDTTLIVYDAALGCPVVGSPCLGSDDDGCGPINFNSSVTIPVVAGSDYLIQIGGWGGSTGAGTLTITPPPPANDACGAATPIGEGFFPFENISAASNGPVTCDNDMTGDVWFLYTASAPGNATIGTCGTTGSLVDTTLIVYDATLGCPGLATPCVASDDDGCGPIGFNSEVTIPVLAGDSYYVQVGGWNGSVGNGTLTIALGDTCAVASAVAEGVYPIENSGSLEDGPTDCDANMTGDLWFLYTASASGTATIGTCATVGTLDDTTLIVYDAALGCPVAGSPCLASDDDNCGPIAFNSEVSIPVLGGASYYLQVGGWNGTVGDGTLTIDLALIVPNDLCPTAVAVAEGTFAINNINSTTNGPVACDLDMTGDVWFVYTATATGNSTIDTCATVASLTDTTLIVYDGALGCPGVGSPCLASDDDSCGPAAFNSSVTIPVVAGASYIVQVGGWNGTQGTGTLTIANVPVGCPSPGPSQFRRGDCNADGAFNIADPIFSLAHLFPPVPGGGPFVPCFDAVDGNDDGTLNIADPVFLLSVLFPAGPPVPMPPPAAACGCDPTADTITCVSFLPWCP